MQDKDRLYFRFLTNYFVDILAKFTRNKNYILYKYLPTSILLLLSAYLNSFLRGVKDAVLVPELGAELISFVKFYGVFPSTILFFICFSKISNIWERDRVYYTITTFFITFFMAYAFILHPYSEVLSPDLSRLIELFPKLQYQIIMIENWTISVFYIMCELCCTVILSLLFWQFANELYTLQEAKKTYALFGVIGQGGITVAGLVQQEISKYCAHNIAPDLVWDSTLKYMMVSVFMVGIALMVTYRWMYKNVFWNKELCNREHSNKPREKLVLSVKESARYVFSSKYLWLIMTIVFCYGVGVNLLESLWKNQLKQRYLTPHEYNAFMGNFNFYFGLVSMIIMALGSYILRRFKWKVTALVTPLGAGVTGMLFFLIIIFRNYLEPLMSSMGTTVLMMSVIVGSVQVMVFKSCNYTFVDSTKEMAFMPLDREFRTKGKAAVDVIGGRFGKSFGGIMQQLMLQFIDPSLDNLTCQLFFAFVVIMALWTISVIELNKKFNRISKYAAH